MASRACRKLGLGGLSFIPSVTSCRINSLPTEYPCLRMRFARASHKTAHQISPSACTSDAFRGLNGLKGLRGTPSCGTVCDGSISRRVRGFLVRSVEYGYLRIP